jgi:hypothetical protein
MMMTETYRKPQPKFFGGLNLDATYKAWDINLYFYGSEGNKILNYVESNLESFARRGSVGAENVNEAYYRITGRQPIHQTGMQGRWALAETIVRLTMFLPAYGLKMEVLLN